MRSSIRCMICGTDPAMGGAAVYRLNDKGQSGVWACEPHYAKAKRDHFPDDDPTAPAPAHRGGPDAFPHTRIPRAG